MRDSRDVRLTRPHLNSMTPLICQCLVLRGRREFSVVKTCGYREGRGGGDGDAEHGLGSTVGTGGGGSSPLADEICGEESELCQ